MLARTLQTAALAGRVLTGSLTQTVAQVEGRVCSPGPLPCWSDQRHLWSPPLWTALQTQAFATAAAAHEEPTGLLIHPSAAARLRELQAEKPDSRLALRIEVEGGGCSGFQYKFRLEDQGPEPKQEDIMFESDGGRVVCDAISLEFLRGATLEFEDTIMRAAFTISSNPNAEASCGCGSSFAAKIK